MTAMRMTEDLDAGPVYLKEDMCLESNAEQIYIRASYLSARMIRKIIEQEPKPQPQRGEPYIFKRRKPNQSKISDLKGLQALHDFIRMLDAEGYPRAFIKHNGFRYEFSRALLYDGRITADVTITLFDKELS
jgi:methionyl-tRNA formyltransferase